MTLKEKLNNLPLNTKKRIAKLSRKLMKEFPNLHTIIINTQPGSVKGELFTDFELIVFFNGNTDLQKPDCKSSRPDNIAGGYKMRECFPVSGETIALYYEYSVVPEKLQNDYLNLLSKHRMFFVKNDFPDVTAVNSAEMYNDDPKFYKLYITNQFEKGYLIYNSDLKPVISLPGGVMDQADPEL